MFTYRKFDQLQLIGYTDSDFAGCIDSRNSSSGYVFLMAGEAVSWKSVKQILVASSTMEAEFVACYETNIKLLLAQKEITCEDYLEAFLICLKLTSKSLIWDKIVKIEFQI